jgi:hypothetical protein
LVLSGSLRLLVGAAQSEKLGIVGQISFKKSILKENNFTQGQFISLKSRSSGYLSRDLWCRGEPIFKPLGR